MRTIHLSDLHFGTEIPSLLENLRLRLKETNADLLIVSGDFTQIGSSNEFARAKEFIDSIGIPFFCVPGNHDIPRFSLFDRFFNPYTRYKNFFGTNLSPVYDNDDICIVGVNTARRVLPHWNWAHGALSKRQMKNIKEAYESSASRKRVLVMHHPIHKARDNDFKTIVFGAKYAMQAIKDMRIDIVLTGHVHHASITMMESDVYSCIFLSASTALSRRIRKSANGYNLITISADNLEIEIFSYQDNQFGPIERFERKIS